MKSYSVILAQSAYWWLLPASCVLGLIVGSFLNVVVARLPVMMQRGWQLACAEVCDLPPPEHPRFNLAWPRSHCPACHHTLRWHELIPVLSWLWLRARCAHCNTRISPIYPLTELATAALFAGCVIRFGFSPTTLAAMALCAALLTLALIDARTMLLPDAITQPLLWAGLLLSLTDYGFVTPFDAIVGASAGYAALWLLATGFRLVAGKEGMGQGDWKLLAALGAWFGWQALPTIALAASVAGIVISVLMMLLRRMARDQPLPFGPYLAAAGLVILFWPALTWPGPG